MQEPNHLLPPEKKGKQWILDAAKWLWYSYGSFNTNIGYANTRLSDDRNLYSIWRNFRIGNQPVKQYKSILDCEDSENKVDRIIDWTPLPIMAQKADTIKGGMSSLGYKMSATAINPLADNERLQVKTMYEFRQLIAKIFPENAPGDSEPKTPEELEMFMNDYKLGAEIASETAWECIAYSNGFKEIIHECVDDIIDYGIMGIRDYIENGVIKVRRVNTENLVFGQTTKSNFSDCTQFGEVRYVSLAELKRMDNGKTLSDEDLKKIGQKYLNHDKGINYNFDNQLDYNKNYGIPVLDFSIESVNERVWVTDKEGNVTEKPTDWKVGDSSDFVGKEERRTFRVFYTGIWIVDTDYLINYGLETNIKRSKNSIVDATPSWHLHAPTIDRMQCYSLVSRCIPFINAINLAWYQMQFMIAKAKPRGAAIETGGIMAVDGVAGGPLERIESWVKENILLWSSKDSNGNFINGGQVPIKELEGGLPRDFQLFFQTIQNNIQMMNQVIGLNNLTDASNPEANIGKSIAIQSIKSSNNSLQPLYMAYESVLTRTANSAIMRYQDLNPEGKEDYAIAVGTGTVQFFNIHKDISLYDIGVKFEPSSNEEDIKILEAQLANELAIRTQGGAGGLLFEDVLAIREAMKTSFKRAATMLAIRRKQRQAEDQAIAQQNAEQNAQMQNAPLEFKAQMEQMKVESKLQMKQMELQSKEKELSMMAQIQQMQQELITQREVALRQLENKNNIDVAYIKSEGKSSEIAQQGEIDGHLIMLEAEVSNNENKKN